MWPDHYTEQVLNKKNMHENTGVAGVVSIAAQPETWKQCDAEHEKMC